jgi:hypothetical protein
MRLQMALNELLNEYLFGRTKGSLSAGGKP